MRLERFSCKTDFINLEIEGDEAPLHASSDTHKTGSTLIETVHNTTPISYFS